MPYNETTVVIGGLMHIPVIIIFIRFIENRFNKRSWTIEELNYNKQAYKLLLRQNFKQTKATYLI